MRSIWRSKNTAYPQMRCFFCQTTSVILPPFQPGTSSKSTGGGASTSALTISTGTAENWFCSSCQCWNAYHLDGRFKDQWLRPMWDEQWNEDRNQLLQHQRGGPIHSQKQAVGGSERVFCHTCQTNQTLQVHLLADYLPDPDDPAYQERVERLPAYRNSIAARYPSICSNCAPLVQKRIQDTDRMARSWTFAQWLGKNEAPSPSKKQPERKGQDEARKTRQQAEIRWYRQGTCWILSTLIALACYGVAARRPDWVQEAMLVAEYLTHEEPLSPANAVLLLALAGTLFLLSHGAEWDSTAKKVSRAKSRGVRAQVTGLADWMLYQRIAFLLRRMVVLFLVARVALSTFLPQHEPARILQTIGTALLAGETALLLMSTWRLRVSMPRPLKLVSKPLYATQPSTDPFEALSLSDPPTSRPNAPTSPFTANTAWNEDEDEPMPTAAPADFQLGAQRFFPPEQPTGLETLFGQAVSLADPAPTPANTSSAGWRKLLGLNAP